jgi:hypothetical protein
MIEKLLNIFRNRNEKMYPKGIWTFEVRDDKTGRLVERVEKENLVPNIGLYTIAAQFGSTSITKDIGDNLYIALGDDNTAPAAGDTTLGNETVRKAISDKNASSAVASISVFFASGEATGTHAEVGLFGDGNTTAASGAADSGILYSHTLLPVTVGASQNLTVTYTLTFST